MAGWDLRKGDSLFAYLDREDDCWRDRVDVLLETTPGLLRRSGGRGHRSSVPLDGVWVVVGSWFEDMSTSLAVGWRGRFWALLDRGAVLRSLRLPSRVLAVRLYFGAAAPGGSLPSQGAEEDLPPSGGSGIFVAGAGAFAEAVEVAGRAQGTRGILGLVWASAEERLVPRRRPLWWRSVLGLLASSSDPYVHRSLAVCLATAFSTLQIDTEELRSFGVIAWHYGVWEPVYAEAFREAFSLELPHGGPAAGP